MRPVERGTTSKRYTKYKDAFDDLVSCIGSYCSYCERRLQVSLAVEHVSPKSKDQKREKDWDNFLLACPNCNSVKGAKITNDRDFLWPDKDNTLLAYEYKEGGIVEVRCKGHVAAKARKLIDLVGLDRHPGQLEGKRPTKDDRRYMNREEVWKLAVCKRDALSRNDNDDFKNALIDIAKAEGFFGVWMAVFEGNIDMRRRLVSAFKGTALSCFDADGNCRPRAGGHI